MDARAVAAAGEGVAAAVKNARSFAIALLTCSHSSETKLQLAQAVMLEPAFSWRGERPARQSA